MRKQEKLHRYVSVSGPGKAPLRPEEASHDAPVAAGEYEEWTVARRALHEATNAGNKASKASRPGYGSHG
jgi:hypothetical protein